MACPLARIWQTHSSRTQMANCLKRLCAIFAWRPLVIVDGWIRIWKDLSLKLATKPWSGSERYVPPPWKASWLSCQKDVYPDFCRHCDVILCWLRFISFSALISENCPDSHDQRKCLKIQQLLSLSNPLVKLVCLKQLCFHLRKPWPFDHLRRSPNELQHICEFASPRMTCSYIVRFTNPLALRSSKGKRVGEPDLQLHCFCTWSNENQGDVELGKNILLHCFSGWTVGLVRLRFAQFSYLWLSDGVPRLYPSLNSSGNYGYGFIQRF